MNEFTLCDFKKAIKYVHYVRISREKNKIQGKIQPIGTIYMFMDKKTEKQIYFGECHRNPTPQTNVATRILAHIETITNLGLMPKYKENDLRKMLYDYKIYSVYEFFKNWKVYIIENFYNILSTIHIFERKYKLKFFASLLGF